MFPWPAWAVGSYSSGPPAGGAPQILVDKTSPMTGRLRVYLETYFEPQTVLTLQTTMLTSHVINVNLTTRLNSVPEEPRRQG